jgi:MoaA/NifB/PqqE/SkfB family radical SAM enzyme
MMWHFNVDVVAGCNLRCPSCPVGNSPGANTARGYMTPELLGEIVDKARAECERVKFSLYNWTEPFLHPRLHEMVGAARSRGVRCGISSNFNIIRNIDAVMEANPTYLKMSVSGFTQESYGVTHEKGDIEVVKENMAIVAEAKRRARATTRLTVPFHRYLGNHEDEERMRGYAESLGFEFNPAWAFLMPLEKALAFADPETTDVTLTETDRAIIARLALPLDQAIAESRTHPMPCKLRDEQMTIDCQGNVMLCCTVYDSERYRLGSYLDMPLEKLQALKYEHPQCESCMRNGLHVLFTYGAGERLDEIAIENVAKHHPDANLLGMREHARKPRGIRAWPSKIRKKYQAFFSNAP